MYVILARIENFFSDSDIKQFTSQVMKLMISS